MTAYAANTSVPVERSRAEIERNLKRFGADGFGYGWEGSVEVVAFTYRGKQVRLTLPMPSPTGYRSEAAREKERRRRWRSLGMVIKALLVGVEDDILSFEEAFLSYFVMPDGQTLGDRLIPQLEAAAHRGELPSLMTPREGR
jgi:hypothetical protein